MRHAIASLLLTFLLSLGVALPAQAETLKVLMSTSLGDITLELYPDKAPKTVANFLQYADEGFYDNTIFHRVIYDFMIQGGGFTADLKQKQPHASIRNEADNGLRNDRGTIAMARTPDPHSATAQFFINHKDNDALNYRSKDFQGWGYCVFGKVAQGMAVVDKIAEQPTAKLPVPGFDDAPKQTIFIKSVKRIN